MTRHLDEGQLNDFREGLLKSNEREVVQAHLEGCSRCRGELEGLTQLAADMAGLPLEAEPPRDLWPQISWRVEGEKVREATPVPAEKHGRRVSLPAWQFLAASIALMVISGGIVWAFLSGGTTMDLPSGVPVVTSVQSVSWEEAYRGYDEAVADLEDVLERGRDILDPETVRVLQESLQAIDLAIEEAGAAVREDPASPVLQRFLAENLRKKMDLLRRAAMAVHANT